MATPRPRTTSGANGDDGSSGGGGDIHTNHGGGGANTYGADSSRSHNTMGNRPIRNKHHGDDVASGPQLRHLERRFLQPLNRMRRSQMQGQSQRT